MNRHQYSQTQSDQNFLVMYVGWKANNLDISIEFLGCETLSSGCRCGLVLWVFCRVRWSKQTFKCAQINLNHCSRPRRNHGAATRCWSGSFLRPRAWGPSGFQSILAAGGCVPFPSPPPNPWVQKGSPSASQCAEIRILCFAIPGGALPSCHWLTSSPSKWRRRN